MKQKNAARERVAVAVATVVAAATVAAAAVVVAAAVVAVVAAAADGDRSCCFSSLRIPPVLSSQKYI